MGFSPYWHTSSYVQYLLCFILSWCVFNPYWHVSLCVHYQCPLLYVAPCSGMVLAHADLVLCVQPRVSTPPLSFSKLYNQINKMKSNRVIHERSVSMILASKALHLHTGPAVKQASLLNVSWTISYGILMMFYPPQYCKILHLRTGTIYPFITNVDVHFSAVLVQSMWNLYTNNVFLWLLVSGLCHFSHCTSSQITCII